MKWFKLTHDSFSDPEDELTEFSGTLIAITSGFLGIGLIGVVSTEHGTIHEVSLSKLRT